MYIKVRTVYVIFELKIVFKCHLIENALIMVFKTKILFDKVFFYGLFVSAAFGTFRLTLKELETFS